ncbi:hypothetical protein M440DRAFT_244812 [Trichoderma longibrachiatum ATCC 18648]|uniref:Secreted protein n=1 Tax=Trichoderma longibrachiatum ATCC 18648 TaxID=983965 RepID=A0A2T4CDN4_TRILO|nr:hypothetical protein M440DRAFT_244812 [Trichoderma longibrachiatum ATCC 18648]
MRSRRRNRNGTLFAFTFFVQTSTLCDRRLECATKPTSSFSQARGEPTTKRLRLSLPLIHCPCTPSKTPQALISSLDSFAGVGWRQLLLIYESTGTLRYQRVPCQIQCIVYSTCALLQLLRSCPALPRCSNRLPDAL